MHISSISTHTALLNDAVADGDSSHDSSHEEEEGGSAGQYYLHHPHHPHQGASLPSLEAFLAQRLAFPTALYLGSALLLLLVGVGLGAPEGRVAVGVLLAAILRCVFLFSPFLVGRSADNISYSADFFCFSHHTYHTKNRQRRLATPSLGGGGGHRAPHPGLFRCCWWWDGQ